MWPGVGLVRGVPRGLTWTERHPHAQLVVVICTARRWLAMSADRAISGGRADRLRAGRGVLGAVFHAFGAGFAVETVGKLTRAVVGGRTDLPAGSVAETRLASGT